MITAGEIEAKMSMDNSRLKADAKEAAGIVDKTGSEMTKSFSAVQKALGVIGVGLSIGYFQHVISNSIDAMDKLGDLAKKTKLTVEQVSGLKLAAEQSGTNIEGVARAINMLETNMGRLPQKYADLGVSAKDPLEAFGQFADILNKIEDPAVKAATASAALGRSWTTVAPLLAEGSVKIREMVEVGTKLSGVTTADAAAADNFKDRLAEFHMAGDAFRNNVTRLILPGLNDIITAMSTAAQQGGLLKSLLMGLGTAGKVALFGADPTKIEKQKQDIASMKKELKDAEEAQADLIKFQEKHGPIAWQTQKVEEYKLAIHSLKIGIEQMTRALENMQRQAEKPLPDAETTERAKRFSEKPVKKPRAQKQGFIGEDQFGGGFIKTGFGDISGSPFGGDTDEMLREYRGGPMTTEQWAKFEHMTAAAAAAALKDALDDDEPQRRSGPMTNEQWAEFEHLTAAEMKQVLEDARDDDDLTYSGHGPMTTEQWAEFEHMTAEAAAAALKEAWEDDEAPDTKGPMSVDDWAKFEGMTLEAARAALREAAEDDESPDDGRAMTPEEIQTLRDLEALNNRPSAWDIQRSYRNKGPAAPSGLMKTGFGDISAGPPPEEQMRLTKQQADNDAALEQQKEFDTEKQRSLAQSLKTQWEIEDEDYLAKQEIITERLKNDTVNTNAWLERKARLIQEHTDKVKNIEKSGWSEREKFAHLSMEAQAADIFGTLVSVTQGVAQHNRAMFEINKGAGIAMAVINAFEGISLTLAKYPAPLSFAMAAVQAAAAWAQVDAIRSATFSGGGRGSAPSIAGSTPAQPVSVTNAAPTSGFGQSTSVHLHGENYSRKQVKDLVNQINERTRDGGRVTVE